MISLVFYSAYCTALRVRCQAVLRFSTKIDIILESGKGKSIPPKNKNEFFVLSSCNFE